MKIHIPDISELNCIHLVACGEIKSKKRSVLDWIKTHAERQFFEFKADTTKIYGRAWLGGAKNSRHCHIELATPAYFRDGGGPPAGSKTSTSIEKLLGPLLNEEIVADVSADFIVKCDNLPDVVKLMSAVKGIEGDVEMTVTGGLISVKGAPVYRIGWIIRSDGDAQIMISAESTFVLTPDYLADCLSMIKTSYDALLRGKS